MPPSATVRKMTYRPQCCLPIRGSAGSVGTLSRSTGWSFVPSTGQNPELSSNSRWQPPHVFIPSARARRLGNVVEDAFALRALLELVRPQHLLEHHRRDGDVAAAAGPVRGARDGPRLARADRFVAPVEDGRQEL